MRPCPQGEDDRGAGGWLCQFIAQLLSDKLVDDITLLIGGGGGRCGEAAETGGADSERTETAIL